MANTIRSCVIVVVFLLAGGTYAQAAGFVRPLTELNEPVGALPKSISVQIFPGEFETVVVGNSETTVADAGGLEVEEFRLYTMRYGDIAKAPGEALNGYPPAVCGVLLNVPFYMVPKGMKCESLSSLAAIRIHVPRETPPGKRLVELKSGGLSVEVEVLPFELPRAEIAFGMYWDCGRYPQEYLEGDWTRILEDMRDHGQTSVTAYDRDAAGEPVFLANGDFNPDPRNRLSRHIQIGLDVGLLSSDIPVMMLSTDVDAKQAVSLKAHAADHGWPEIFLYSRDEPPRDAEAEMAKWHAEFNALGFRDITALIGSGSAWVMGEHLNVWVVHMRITSALMEYARRSGAEVWTYDCIHRGTNPRYHRHYAGLHTWAMKLKGNFLWAYVHTAKSLVKPDGTWAPNITFEYVLPTPEGPIPTVGWEGRRDGIVDYRVMTLLEHELFGNPKHPAAPRIAEWLHDIRVRASTYAWFRQTNPWDHRDLVTPPGFEAGDYDAIRRQAVAYILELRKAPASSGPGADQ